MQCKAEVRLLESREQAVGDHRLGAGDGFLGRLRDEHQRPMPTIFQVDQRLGRADPARHVNVMAAAMIDEGLLPVPVGLVAARIGQSGLLFHRRRIELGPHQNGGAFAIFVDRDKSGLADLFRHLETKRAQSGVVTPANVDTVMVDGHIIKRAGHLMHFDVPEIVHRAERSALRIRQGPVGC